MYEQLELVLLHNAVEALLDKVKRFLDLTPGPGGSGMTDPLATAEACGGLAREYGLLDGKRLLMMRVVSLCPSQQIVAHTDPPIAGIRHHAPLVVNNGCWSFHGGVWQQLEVGRVYRMAPTVMHGAVNWGHTTRLHLMVDTEEEIHVATSPD